ncbi:hypothetical protein HMPREF9103_00085 [Lentilactobacillus parafarraginis F0439]|uniref:Uncharacterized protein n=1 Tax=Lentilactobacillus parafarraginis F0439 TaxID=797515 RepID=G9ZK39_9LACO|nr:hypothetical protein [Lentilactobacillus parafarraginis]EHM01462.1 hypothetical protein HMPREF9103_00085 [Lentilactobacillus parafarraginis F0439]
MTNKIMRYSLTAIGLLLSMKTIADLHKDYQKNQTAERSLRQIISDQRKLSGNGTYLGSWQVADSDGQYHFGLNYRNADGQVLVNEYWADRQSGTISNQRAYALK